VLRAVPDHAGGLLQLAETLRLSDEPEAAVAMYTRAVERDPDALRTVISGIEQCLAETPADASLHLTLGRLEEVHGAGAKKAVTRYTAGLRAVGDDADADALRAARGRSYRHVGKMAEAYADLRLAARTHPLPLEDAEFVRGRFRDELREEVRRRRSAPEDEAEALGTAGLLFLLGRYEECLGHLQGRESDDTVWTAKRDYLKGLAFQKDGLHDLARVSLNRCASALPEDHALAKHARLALAIGLESTGHYDAAVEALAGIVQVDATFASARERMRRLGAECQGRSTPPPLVVELGIGELPPVPSGSERADAARPGDPEAR
jgi:tetratricopeptide (TPR) repeat protein